MTFGWLSAIKELPHLIEKLGGLIVSSRSKKKLLISELSLNLKHFHNVTQFNLTYEELIGLLSNTTIHKMREEGFIFSSVKMGKISPEHIRDERNKRYLGKDCEWLFINISDKIQELKQLKNLKGALNFENSNIPLQCSNLFYKLKLLTEFINS